MIFASAGHNSTFQYYTLLFSLAALFTGYHRERPVAHVIVMMLLTSIFLVLYFSFWHVLLTIKYFCRPNIFLFCQFPYSARQQIVGDITQLRPTRTIFAKCVNSRGAGRPGQGGQLTPPP